MTRLFCVGITVAAILFAVPALASVPFADNCIITFYGNPAAGVIRTCPDGDWDKLDVTVKDQFDLPIPLQTVTVTFTGTPSPICAGPISGATNASGYVRLALPIGTVSTVDSPRLTSTYTVSAMGYTIGGGTV